MGELDLGDIFGGKDSPYREIQQELWSEVPMWISFGCPPIDYAISAYRPGVKGGCPAGRVVELWGEEMACKSSILDKLTAEAQKMGCAVLGCDREHTHEAKRMMLHGVDPSKIRFIEKPIDKEVVKKRGKRDAIEEARDVTLEEFFFLSIEGVKKIKAVSPDTHVLVWLDSLTAMKTNMEEEATGEDRYSEGNMRVKSDKSILLSDVFPKYCSDITALGASFIFVSQVREKPGVLYGESQYASGGKAKSHMCSLRIRLHKGAVITADKDPLYEHECDDAVGLNVKFEVHKNKLFDPYRRGNFVLYFDQRGLWYPENLWNLIEYRKKIGKGTLEKVGAWYSYKGERIGQGRSNVIKYLHEHPDIALDMEREFFLEVENGS